ncbi:MAG: helix-turn-helix domain-containing protein [Saprospiraceae bacterium]
MKHTFKTHQPASSFLRKYIAYYYFHQTNEKNGKLHFTYYPHIKNALTIYKNSSAVMLDDYTSRTIPNANGYFFAYTKLLQRYSNAELNAPFDKVGIVFQPLGINHFIEENLSEIINKEINPNLHYFKTSMSPFLDKIYALDDLNKKVACLDDYFQSIFVDFEEQRLVNAIQLILDSEQKFTVQSLATTLNINRKTLLRLFKKHLCCSVKDYLGAVQFRRALEVYQSKSQKPLLTHLAFDVDYYDQSDFINHFTKITGFNPKRFFKKVVKYGEEETFWSFDEKL